MNSEQNTRDHHEFRDKAVNQTLTLLFGNDVERRAVAKDLLADLFDMGMNEQKRVVAASIDRRKVVREAFEKATSIRDRYPGMPLSTLLNAVIAAYEEEGK